MKSISVFLKENLSSIPFPIGNLLSHIPYANRPGIGDIYSKRKSDINTLAESTSEEIKAFILKRFQTITFHAYFNVPFYKIHYDKQKFHPSQLKHFSDISLIPIITKSLLQQYDIEYRSAKIPNRYTVNTGGSSGKPLTLYISPDSMGHEWAHMHTIWSKLDFKPSDLKISFGGRSDDKNFMVYDAVRHSYNFNIYKNLKDYKKELMSVVNSKKVKFLHGYPSAIYELAIFCRKRENADLLHSLKSNLLGAFLGSEYPTPAWRSFIEETFEIDSVSWYGHTERAVLAYEKNEKYVYHPFLSYGYSEALSIDSKQHLIATSYYNCASPLIRYDTEDIIDPLSLEQGILRSFKVSEGRIGEFVLDRNYKKIPLTGLIFGRHHELFNVSKHIQVSQKTPGHATILYTPIDFNQQIDPENLFDATDIAIQFKFKATQQPIKTISGKVRLLVDMKKHEI